MDRKKGILDRIGSLIPGYRGYAERDGRRNCDKQLRESIHFELTLIEKQISNRILDAIKSKEMDLIRKLEVLRKDVNTLGSKLKYAPYGETAFFGDKQIKEDELLEIYQFDLELADVVQKYKDEIVLIPIEKIELYNTSIFGVLNARNSYINEFK